MNKYMDRIVKPYIDTTGSTAGILYYSRRFSETRKSFGIDIYFLKSCPIQVKARLINPDGTEYIRNIHTK